MTATAAPMKSNPPNPMTSTDDPPNGRRVVFHAFSISPTSQTLHIFSLRPIQSQLANPNRRRRRPMEAALQALFAAVASFFFVSGVIALIIIACRRPAKPVLPHSHPHPHHDESASFDPSIARISMPVLAAATDNFSPAAIIGDGSFGFVYKAVLPTGATVAVKRLSADAFHGPREFRAEMETLGHIHHRHLARLLGYCVSGRDRLLIYEFLHNGSLDAHLHDPAPAPATLPWPIRLRVARGAARGIAFLHRECVPRIIHRDIKASNVLLDDEFEARIADFGLARRVDLSRSHVSTQVAGTMGYMPPEYREGAAATVMGDVFSFGVLLMEMVTGHRPNWPLRGEGGREEGLVRWVRGAVKEGRAMEAVDERIEEVAEEEVVGLLAVARRCTEEVPRDRPEMGDVVSMLDKL